MDQHHVGMLRKQVVKHEAPIPNHQLLATTPWSNPTMVGAKVMCNISHAI